MPRSVGEGPRRRNVAVLLAGGVGTRIGADLPKQLITIAGRPMLEHSLAALHDHPMVDEVLIMMAPGYLDRARTIVRDGCYTKVADILEGGETRNATAFRALDWLGEQDGNVLLHDAARPLVPARVITDCWCGLEDYDAVFVGIPSADTIVEVSPDGTTLSDIPARSRLRRGQTPQAFRTPVIQRAYALARRDPDFMATDCSSVATMVFRYLPDVPIGLVRGDERNIKVTDPIDVHLADRLFQLIDESPSDPAAEGRSDGAWLRAALTG